MSKIRGYVDDINAAPNTLLHGQHGPCTSYELPDENLKGRLEFKFFDNVGKGVACNLESKGEGWLCMVLHRPRIAGHYHFACLQHHVHLCDATGSQLTHP
jgi:hypothetical protein